MGEPTTWAQVKTRFAPPVERVALCSRPDLVARIEELKDEHRVARYQDEMTNEPDRAPGIADEIEALREEALAATVTFVLQGVPAHVEEALQEKYPPTAEQLVVAKRDGFRLAYDPDAFQPALLAACCVEPTGMTLADWNDLWAGFTDGQRQRFRNTLAMVNHGVSDVPKGLSDSAKTAGTATS
jgi:hypothetical protein